MEELKLFNRWSISGVVVKDLGLKNYINVNPYLAPISQGKFATSRFWKNKKSIFERLMNKLFGSGHKGKKHWRTSGRNAGKKQLVYNITKKALLIIEQKTKKNPLQVLVDAVEAGAPKEGVATIEYGGVRYPKSMDLAPQRRVDLALRWLTQGAYAKAVSASKPIWEALADEIMATVANDANNSNTIKKRSDLEKQAEVSR